MGRQRRQSRQGPRGGAHGWCSRPAGVPSGVGSGFRAEELNSAAGFCQHGSQLAGPLAEQGCPVAEVGSVLRDLTADREPLGEEERAEFGDQLLTGIGGTVGRMAAGDAIAIQATAVAGGVDLLMGPGGEEGLRGMEGLLRWQVDLIAAGEVVGLVGSGEHGNGPCGQVLFGRGQPLGQGLSRCGAQGITDGLFQGPVLLGPPRGWSVLEIRDVEDECRPEAHSGGCSGIGRSSSGSGAAGGCCWA